MRFIHGFPRSVPVLACAAVLLFAGCGDDDGPASPGPDPDPEVGVPDGAPATATLGPGGGSLASADGAFTLEVPAGALAADTQVTIQPITNLAGGGLGKAYRLTPDGLQFAAPVDIVFEISDDALAVTAPEFLDGAVQRDDGRWGILAIEEVDMSARTLTCRTSHFSDYSMVSGVQIQPASATIDPGASILLRIVYCSLEPVTGDPDLVALIGTCDPDLVPLGAFTDWSANGIVGGSLAEGVVVPSGNQATYTAPPTTPSSNPVAVSVQATFDGMSGLLVSNITVRGAERWVGTCTAVTATGTLQVNDLVWEFESTDGYQRFFHPRGTVMQTAVVLPGTETVSYAPSTDPILPDESGGMSVDYTTDPPTFSGGGADYWKMNACFLFPGPPPEVGCIPFTGGGAWFGAVGEVTENGTKIEGTAVSGPGGELFTFSFTREE